LDARGIPINLHAGDLERVKDILELSWEESTRASYGAGLLVYHVFCDRKAIAESHRAPASPVLIAAFVSTIAGAYAGRSISNYVFGIRAWHILHGIDWKISTLELTSLLKAAEKTAPASSKKPKRAPYTIDFMLAVREKLNLSLPLHAAVFACLTTTFYATARVGEFTIPRLDAFSPQKHVTPSCIRTEQDRHGLKSTVFHIPSTKAAPVYGEDVSWSAQSGLTDPEAAIAHHFQVNTPPVGGALFAYRFKDGHRPLTKPKLLETLARAAREAGLDPRQGHGIRIGSTLEYLLRGVPFDVMKVKGRWASDAFKAYLTKHAQILAPYMQDQPALHSDFVRLTMPPVR
jgi:hypothetical protein